MRLLLAFVVSFFLLPAVAEGPSTPLHAKHAELAPRLAASPFGKPLLLEAADDGHRVSGDAFAVLEHGFSRASAALTDPAQWCQILLLPFNTKHCEASSGTSRALALTVHIGRKYSTPLEKTHRLEFRFDVPARSRDLVRVELAAPEGPFGTREYRIVLEMVPLGDRRTFMHFGYSYAYGTMARAAMQAYLATIAANKVGFTRENDGLVKGMRGVMERNTMRYFLAIEAYLGAQGAPAGERPSRMVEDWFAAVERHPRQLHELTREEYVPMKLAEYERMLGAAPSGTGSKTVNPVPRMASSWPSPS